MEINDINERRYREYQEFLAQKRSELTDDLGAVALVPFTLGIIEAGNPSSHSIEAEHQVVAPNAYKQRVAELSLALTVARPESIPVDQTAIIGHHEDYVLAS